MYFIVTGYNYGSIVLASSRIQQEYYVKDE